MGRTVVPTTRKSCAPLGVTTATADPTSTSSRSSIARSTAISVGPAGARPAVITGATAPGPEENDRRKVSSSRSPARSSAGAAVLGRLRPDGAEARPSDARRRACSRLRSVRCSDIGDVVVAPPDEGVPVPAHEAGGRSEMVEAGEVHEHPGDRRDAQDHAEQAGAHRHASSAQPGFQRQPRAGDRAGREAGPAPEAGGERRPARRGRALTPGRRPRSDPGTAHDEGERGRRARAQRARRRAGAQGRVR